MKTELIKELIDDVALDFRRHLALTGNDRILMSGKFGKGKTTFLTEFFGNQTEHLNGILYNAIFIDPVNYTVSSNEDIFKYIKYDILIHLLIRQKLEIESIDLTFAEASQYYIVKHPFETIKGFLRYIPKVGLLMDQALPSLEKLHTKIIEVKKAAEGTTGDATANEFFMHLQNESFSIYENDIITQLIRKLLATSGNLKNVLIIDNLDRIDPEHIFRILNIFSTQINYSDWGEKHDKFFFEKVIIVCDIQNIRNIYANRYGINVDFSGYIDKFYSIDIFHFQNYEQLKRCSHNILRRLIVADSWGQKSTLNQFGHDFGIFYLITTLVWQNQISLRQLQNFCRAEMWLPEIMVSSLKGRAQLPSFETPLMEMIVMSKLVGGYQELDRIINILMGSNASINDHVKHFHKLLHFKLWKQYAESTQGEYQWSFNGEQLKITIQGDLGEYGMITQLNKYQAPVGFVSYIPTNLEFFQLYLQILKEFHLLKYIE